jgi:hypothetical protein
LPLAHDARNSLDAQRRAKLRFMEAPHVGDRAVDRLSLFGVERSFGGCELRGADLDCRQGNSVEPSREFQQCRVAALTHVVDDLAHSVMKPGRVLLHGAAQCLATFLRR